MKKIAIITIVLFVIFWGLSILKCEYLTLRYGEQFDSIFYYDNSRYGWTDNFTVLDYSESYARIYYTVNNRSSGNVVTFTKEDGEWLETSYITIWSKMGSADDFVWPYIR